MNLEKIEGWPFFRFSKEKATIGSIGNMRVNIKDSGRATTSRQASHLPREEEGKRRVEDSVNSRNLNRKAANVS